MANFKVSKDGTVVEVDEQGQPVPPPELEPARDEDEVEEGPIARFGRIAGEIGRGPAAQLPGGAGLAAAGAAAADPAIRSATIESMIPGGRLARTAGAAAGFLFPGGEEESLGAGGGQALMRRLAQRFIPGARMATTAGRRALGAAEAAGAAGGFGAGKALKNRFLGQSADLPTGGSIFFQSATVGASGLAGIALGERLAKIMKVVNRSPERALVRSTNRARTRRLSDAQAELDFGLQSSPVRPRRRGQTAQNFADQIRDDLFPIELTGPEAIKIKTRLSRAFDAMQLDAPRSAKVRNALNLDKETLQAFKGALEAPDEQFLERLFAGSVPDSARRMQSLKRLMVDGQLAPEDFDKISSDWVRNKLLGTAMTQPGKDLGEGFERVLDGRKLRDVVTQIPDALDDMFGSGRAQALLKLSEVMDKIDPSRSGVNPLAAGATSSLWYLGRKALFAASLGGTAGGAAVSLGSAGITTVAIIGIAPIVATVLLDPTIPLKLERALEEPTGRALTAVMRAIASGEQAAPTDDIPASSR